GEIYNRLSEQWLGPQYIGVDTICGAFVLPITGTGRPNPVASRLWLCFRINAMDPLDDLIEFLRFPSVSADSQFKSSVAACADWLTSRLRRAGLQVQRYETAGHPVVVARNEERPGRRTVLIYGHYDVQPPDPVDLWETPPFEPVIKGGTIFARGSTDNKGQIL